MPLLIVKARLCLLYMNKIMCYRVGTLMVCLGFGCRSDNMSFMIFECTVSQKRDEEMAGQEVGMAMNTTTCNTELTILGTGTL